MITVTWTLADGGTGTSELEGDDKWTFGRPVDGEESPSVGIDDPRISRTSVVVRDSGPGPVAFRGQRDNGVEVGVLDPLGSATWIDEGTAQNLTADTNRVVVRLDGEVIITVDVAFDERGTVVERQHASS